MAVKVFHGPVYAILLSAVLSLFPGQGISGLHCDEKTFCLNGKCVLDTSNKRWLTRYCQCDPLWFGKDCSKFICDQRETNPCTSGAECQSVDNYKDYQCKCDDFHSGKHCEISKFNCTDKSCGMHKKCFDDATSPSGYRCECEAGFTGDDCEIDINDCEGVNCNNGTCVDSINSYTCECFVNYTGPHCNHPDYCAIHSTEETYGCEDGICCPNGGTCYNDLEYGRHWCNCISPWLPVFSCRRQYRPCASGPCQNDGTCEPDGYDYFCHCLPNFTGKSCETQIVHCTNNTCLNNGTCVAELTSDGEEKGQHCRCPPYYIGDLCETPFDPCANKCHNNGTCQSNYISDGVYNTVCSCTEYFTGENCNIDINECLPDNPCLNNATCVNVPGSFNCVCQEGFTGERCETNIDDCVGVVCRNNGTCLDLVNNFECSCIPEYSGKLCQWHYSQTCNGSVRGCVDAHTINCTDNYEGTVSNSDGNGFKCSCVEGFIGNRCEAKVSFCLDNIICGGPERRLSCIEGFNNNYWCICKFGYAGDRCEIDIDLCKFLPCKNGGTCRDHGNNLTCQCPAGYAGHDCSMISCDDNSSCVTPCNDMCIHGNCVFDSTNQKEPYHCKCHLNWYGDNCTEFICDSVEEYPCRNNGTCYQHNYTSFGCSCDDQYSGDRCEISKFNCTNASCNGHGNCSDNASLPSGYQCECEAGFTGDDCEIDIDDCEGVNCNNGTCVDGINSYTCECFINYNGPHCNHLDYCAIHSAEETYGCVDGICCANGGTCYNDLENERHWCNCTSPWFPEFNCRRKYQACANNPCQNNGTCEPNGYNYFCHCLPSFAGKNCEKPLSVICINKTCSNGYCVAEITNDGLQIEQCQCSPQYTGDTCEIKIIHCGNTSVCGGPERKLRCTETNSGYQCECKFGYAGDRCEIDIDLCESSPCQNGGTCVDHVSRFTCHCPYGYTGSTCDTILPVTVHPRNIIIPKGGRVTITCMAHILGTLVYVWERKYNQLWTVVSEYNLTTFTTSTIGQFRCKVYNGTVSEVAVVTVQGVFEITEQPKSAVIKQRGSHTLKCNASGPGMLVYSWEKSIANKWTTISRYEASYTIKSPGLYRCRVTNEAGSITSDTASVKHCKLPEISTYPNSQLVAYNTTVTVRCKGSGKRSLQWETRSSNEQPWKIVTQNSNKILEFRSVQTTTQVRCVASDNCGIALSYGGIIKVFKIISHPQSNQVLTGSRVSLTCTSSVSSDVLFTWTHNGKRLQYSKYRKLRSTGGSSKMIITKVKRRDAGDYVCEARCGPLLVVSTTASLTVNKP